MNNINQKKLAKVIGLSEVTLRRWRRTCGMPYMKHSDDSVCFDPKETIDFVARKKPKYLEFFKNAFKRIEKMNG